MKKLPYRTILGKIGWIYLVSNPCLGWAYKECSRFATNYGRVHWQALLRVVGYLKKNKDTHYIVIKRGGGTAIKAWCDADWNGEKDRHLSTTGWIVFFGDTPISWCSRTQRCTTRSTCESEYIALSSLTQEVLYLQMLARSIDSPSTNVPIYSNLGTDEDPGCVRRWREYMREHKHQRATLYSDSTNAISNLRTPPGWLAESLRHVKTAFHFAKQFFFENIISLEHTSGQTQCADIFTKGWGAKTSVNDQRTQLFTKHAMQCLGHGIQSTVT